MKFRIALALFFLVTFAYAGPPPALTTQDQVRAGEALVASFHKAEGFAETPETRAIEDYLQKVSDKVAQNSKHKLPWKFHLSPHPAFRSAVAYPGGQVLVGAGALAIMTSEDQLAAVLGHEIEHIDLDQCSERLTEVMQRDHLTAADFDKLSIDDFGKPYGKDGELAADREGLKLVAAAGYSPQAAVNLLEVYQFLSRNAKPTPPRADSPSLEDRILQAREEIKKEGWDAKKPEKPLDIP